MTPEQHDEARELFLAAAELPVDQRREFLERHGPDAEVRSEVESLLGYHEGETAAERQSTLGRFQLLGRLGRGGMGEVFLARDPRLGREVALKALTGEKADHPEARQRLEAEARSLAALSHPNVASLHGVEDVGDQPFLVLEYVPGESLAERLERGPIPLRTCLDLAIQVASGLEAAHGAGIIHRDLKPSNVMITPRGVAKILDFGLAKRRPFPSGAALSDPSGSGPTEASTLPGTILGTPAYLSPEQARGEEIDPTTDIWSFGCLLFECLAHRRAFEGPTISDTIARILGGEPDWKLLPRDLPADLILLLERCLSKDRSRRLQHAGDIRIELHDVAQRLESGTPSNRWPTSRAHPAAVRGIFWTRPFGVGLLAVLSAALAAALTFTALTRTSTDSQESDREPALATASEHTAQMTSIVVPAAYPLALDSATPLAVGRPAFALSPDGRNLVWTAQTDEGTFLVHRPLDAFDVEPIDGTEGAFGPFFSPDGTWVGFFTVDHLKKVPLAGGAVTHLGEARNPYGAAWTDDGTIYFCDAEGFELVEISDDGRRRQSRRLPARANWPQSMPGGGLLVASPIGTLDPDTGERRQIEEGSFARALDTGHLLYLQEESNLLLAPFDVDSLQLTGPAVPVLPDALGAVSGAMHLAVAKSGLVAYLPGPQVIPRRLLWADGGATQPALPTPNAFAAPVLSPDGSRVAVEVRAPRPDIWVYEFETGRGIRLTRNGSFLDPTWSADGSEVFYFDFEGRRIGARRADGTGEEREVLPDLRGRPTGVSPDGRWLLVAREWDLWLGDLQGQEPPRPLVESPAYEWSGRFSPDGRLFAYTSDASGRYEIYVRPFPGVDSPDDGQQISTQGGEEPAWSGDGRLIYRNGSKILAVDLTTDAAGAIRPGEAEVLAEGDFLNLLGYSYDVHPRTGRLLVMRSDLETPREIRLARDWVP